MLQWFIRFIPFRENSNVPFDTNIRVFTKCWQYKNANIANLVLAKPLETNMTNKVCNPEVQTNYIHRYLI